MTRRIFKICYCGSQGLEEHAIVYAGVKGREAEVWPCSEEHREYFRKEGDVYALFHGKCAKLVGFKRKDIPGRRSDEVAESRMMSSASSIF